MSPDDPRWGQGSTNKQGYRLIKAHGHPVANPQGGALEHRVRLYDAIGPGPYPCHWCGTTLIWSSLDRATKLCIDHLDNNKVNNDPANLVPSCYACNTRRGSVGRTRPPLTHCKRGHAFTPQNEYWYDGRRACKRCRIEGTQRSRDRKRAAGYRQKHDGSWIYDPNRG